MTSGVFHHLSQRMFTIGCGQSLAKHWPAVVGKPMKDDIGDSGVLLRNPTTASATAAHALLPPAASNANRARPRRAPRSLLHDIFPSLGNIWASSFDTSRPACLHGPFDQPPDRWLVA